MYSMMHATYFIIDFISIRHIFRIKIILVADRDQSHPDYLDYGSTHTFG